MGNSFLHGETKIKFHLKMYFCTVQGKVLSAFLKGREAMGEQLKLDPRGLGFCRELGVLDFLVLLAGSCVTVSR